MNAENKKKKWSGNNKKKKIPLKILSSMNLMGKLFLLINYLKSKYNRSSRSCRKHCQRQWWWIKTIINSIWHCRQQLKAMHRHSWDILVGWNREVILLWLEITIRVNQYHNPHNNNSSNSNNSSNKHQLTCPLLQWTTHPRPWTTHLPLKTSQQPHNLRLK